ncbi:MAG: ergothioneine biosynthesis protein EgtC [Phormidesmis sp.]
MCRLLGYLGPPIALEQLVLKPAHSMEVQSYKPKELNTAILNGDGFGLGWHSTAANGSEPFVYRNVLPMWNDRNLADMCRYIHAKNFVVNLRSATHKMPVDLSNCQPFKYKNILFVHNGWIENFFDAMQRPIRQKLCDVAYRSIQGLTDSEHIFALLIHHLETEPGIDLAEALRRTVVELTEMATKAGVRIAANIILSAGDRLIALRYDNQQTAPSLYSLKNNHNFPNSIILASEPLFQASEQANNTSNWHSYNQSELVSIDSDLTMKTIATFS